MEFLPNEYVLGVWFAQKFDVGDIVMCVKKKDGKWFAEYLIRSYKEEKKTTRCLPVSPSKDEDDTRIRMDKLFSNVRRMYTDFYEYIDIKGDYHALIFKLAMTDWIQFKREEEGGECANRRFNR
jgi:hypothetical protein